MAEEREASAGDERIDGGRQPAEAAKQEESATPKPAEQAGEEADKSTPQESSKPAAEQNAPAQKTPEQEKLDEAAAKTPPAQDIDAQVAAKNAFVGATFNGPVSFNDASGKRQLWLRQTGIAARLAKSYVESGTLTELRKALSAGATIIAVCGSSGMGKRSAGLVALHGTGLTPILQFPQDVGVEDLVASVEQVMLKHENACFILANASGALMAALDEYQLDMLQEKLGESGESRLLITTQATPAASAGSLVVVTAVPVPNDELVEAYLERHPADEDTVQRIKSVASTAGMLSFTVLDKMIGKLQSEPGVSDEELLGLRQGMATAEALDTWFGTPRSAREVATLASVVTCDGAPRTDLDEQIDVLEGLLLGENHVPGESVTFGVYGAAGMRGLITTDTRPVETDLGVHQETVYVLEPQLDRTQAVRYLWDRLDGGFRKALLKWLTMLVGDGSSELWAGAARTAGVLLTIDPRYVQTTLIHPWAVGKYFWPTVAAARVLGVPTGLGIPSEAGQRLADDWIGSDDINLRLCAILAYGDLLGAWDVESEAAVRLWRETSAEDGLAGIAAQELGMLCAAGPDARMIRLTVLELLLEIASGQWAGTKQEMGQALWVFGYAVVALARKGELPSGSLRSLLGDEEEKAKDAFVELLARTWSAPYARWTTETSVSALVRALEDEVLERRVLTELIRAAKDAARRLGTVPELGSGLRRALALERLDNPDGVVARRLLDQFFPTS
ncbi:hypothetical protein OG809_35995 [Kribbella soli]